jgi:hypothetical protein
MPLYAIPDRELRDHCKRAIEAIELWMRRLVSQEFTRCYGADYLNAKHPSGDRVIKTEIATALAEKIASEPRRFPTPIDAALLDDLVTLICNQALYEKHFRAALNEAFPDGPHEARTFLRRLIPARNALSHSNPISVHNAYRILCYSHDIIQSIKDYYKATNVQRQFNVPTIIRVTDSLGHAISLSTADRHPDGPGMLDFSHDDKSVLHCGDTLSIEVEIDPSFDPATYEIEWLISNVGGPRAVGPKFVLVLEERYVATRFCAVCRVITNANWHKLGTHDDQIDIAYRVLPPA